MFSGKKLKSAFLRSSASRVVFNHASEIASYGFVAASIALTAKEGLHPNLESAAGLVWLVASAALRLAKKHPDLAFRLNGAGTIAGALLLSASGIHGHDVDWWKVASPIVGNGITGTLVLFQKEIADYADKFKDSPSKIVQGLRQVARYPVIISSIIEAAGCCGLLKSAFQQHQLMNKAIFSTVILADGALAASDPRAQEAFRKENEKHGLKPAGSPVVV